MASLFPGVSGGSQALVLGAGATLGDFEVGVVRFLFERGYAPTFIASSSVGSLNAVKLVEGGSIDPSNLETIWLTKMTQNSDLYVENPDFTALKNVINSIQPGFQQVTNDFWATIIGAAVTGVLGPGAATVTMPLVGLIGLTKTGVDVGQLVTALVNNLPVLLHLQSIYRVDPLIKLLNDPTILDLGRVKNSSINLLMSTVCLETGELCYVTQQGNLLASDASTPHLQMQAIDPQCQPLADTVDNLAIQVADASEPLANGKPNPSLPGLRNQLREAEIALQTCEAAHPGTSGPVTGLSIVDGVLASAATPVGFLPVQLGNQTFTDGGTRTTCPIRAALLKGMQNVWAVQTYQPNVPPIVTDYLTGTTISNFQNASALITAERIVTQIWPQTLVENEINPEGGFGAAAVTVVEPDLDIHSSLTVDPGLIRIRMMHGYMRADDVNTARVLAARAGIDHDPLIDVVSTLLHTTDIVRQRAAIWQREYAVFGFSLNADVNGTIGPPIPAPADPTAVQDVRAMKKVLQQLVSLRMNGLGLDGKTPVTILGTQVTGAVPQMPGDPPNNWFFRWEQHQFSTDGIPLTVPAINTNPKPPIPLGKPVFVTASASDPDSGKGVTGLALLQNPNITSHARLFVPSVSAGFDFCRGAAT